MKFKAAGLFLSFSFGIYSHAEDWVVVTQPEVMQWGSVKPFTMDAMHLELMRVLSGAEWVAPRTYLIHSDSPARLLSNPEVRFVEPNAPYRIDGIHEPRVDPLESLQWALQENEIGQFHLAEAWQKTRGLASVKVAVLDTGIDATHPDLHDNFLRALNAWDPTAPVRDEVGHGTHCAGIIGATQGNREGIVGVNAHVSLIAIQTHDSDGMSNLAALLRGIDLAKREGARIVSASWGGGFRSAALEAAIGEAQNILFVAAAGNGGFDGVGDNNDLIPHYPSDYDLPNLIAVAAHGRDGQISEFSNFSVERPMVSAPGVDVLSTVPGGYDFMSGTSMATPHVSGAAALLLSTNPNLTPPQLIAAIKDSVDAPIGAAHVLEESPTKGRLNLASAMSKVPQP